MYRPLQQPEHHGNGIFGRKDGGVYQGNRNLVPASDENHKRAAGIQQRRLAAAVPDQKPSGNSKKDQVNFKTDLIFHPEFQARLPCYQVVVLLPYTRVGGISYWCCYGKCSLQMVK